MTEQERTDAIDKINGIVVSIIKRNIEAGATKEKAIEQAYNRLNKEYPEVLDWWLAHKMNELLKVA
jgi:hypothetical protein